MTDSAGETKSIIIQVKAGHVTSSQIRDLRGVIEREEAAIGVFISLEPATSRHAQRKPPKPASSKTKSVLRHQTPPALQILSIEDLLGRQKKSTLPAAQDIRSFKQAPKAKSKKKEDAKLF